METLSRLVFTFLLNALWMVLLVTALTAIAAHLLQRTPARYRHVLWVIGLGLALLLPLTTLPESWKLTCRSASVAEMTPSETAPLPAKPPHSTRPQTGPSAGLSQSLPDRAFGDVKARGESRFLLLNPLRRRSRSIALPPYFAYSVLSIYVLSLSCQLIRLAKGWKSSRLLRRKARAHQLPEGLAKFVTQCQAALGLGAVAIRSSSEVAGPATVGFFKPVIVLPDALFLATPAEELTSALCHEMAHVRRRDYLLNLLCEFVFLPLAFHPAAWLLKRRINETRELACDEAAAGRLLSATAYARSLVSLAQSIAPVSSVFRPRYTLGVFDADILEERIMRLLDKRPQVSARRARLLLGGSTLALVTAALAAGMFSLTAVGNARTASTVAPRSNFSGRWELDKSRSELPSPAPDNLVEIIDLHGSDLKVTTTSKDWSTSKPIAVTLFALMLPEFSTTTENRETVQQFGPGQMRSKTHWEGNNLVTEWTLERNGGVAVTGRWVRRLSEDGNTQMVEITGHDSIHNLDGEAKAVFVRREEDLRAFLGTWRGQLEGKTYIRLTFKEGDGTLTGAASVGGFRINESGQVVEVREEPREYDAVPVTDAKLDGALLCFRGKTPDGHAVVLFQMKLVGEDAAELKCRVLDPRAGTPAPGWWKLFRQSNDDSKAVRGVEPVGRVPGGVTGGTVGGVAGGGVGAGVPGGVTGGTVGGVPGGVAGGVVRNVSGSGPAPTESEPGTISGTVFDPSGARVPQASVSISNKTTGAKDSAETNDTGEFSFTGLNPGTYTLSVTKSGFGIYIRTVATSTEKAARPIDIVLQPGDVLQAVDVTAIRPSSASSAPREHGPQRIRVGGQIEATKLVTMKKPEYPEAARAKGIEGVVLLQAVISTDGEPLSLKVISSPDPSLSKAAEDAVHQWRYEPTLLNGVPIEVVTNVAVRFHLED